MAAVSSIQKYMIDGVEIPAYPTSVVPSHNLVSKSWNDMYGVFRDIPVNSKLKVNWVFDIVGEKDLKTLWGTMIYNKILTSKSRFFDINTFFPGIGFVRGNFYLGTPTSFTSKDWQSSVGAINYWQMELHWIEVDGIVLNKPTHPAQAIMVNNKRVYLDGVEDIGEVLNNSI